MKDACSSCSITPTAAAASSLLSLQSNAAITKNAVDAPPSLISSPESPIPVLGSVPRRIPKKKSHPVPATRPPPVINPIGVDRRRNGDEVEETAPALYDQTHDKGSLSTPSSSGPALENRTLPRSLPSEAGNQRSSSPRPGLGPALLLLGDFSLSFSLYLLRYWPEAPLAPASTAPSMTLPFTSLVASRPTIYCLTSRSELSSPLMSDACVKAHERAGHFCVAEMGLPTEISTCFSRVIRFEDVVLFLGSVDLNIVDLLVPVFVSIADVVAEEKGVRLVLGTKYVEVGSPH